MNKLPDYIVLDFLDWLKTDFYDREILLGEDIDVKVLEKLAIKYIDGKNQFKVQFKAAVNKFLNSEEFSGCYDRRCERFKNVMRYGNLCMGCWETYYQCFKNFVLREFENNKCGCEFDAYQLALSVKYFLKENKLQDEPELLQLIVGTKKDDMSIVLDFVNWLKENSVKLDFGKIPVERISLYLDEYENVTNRRIDKFLKRKITRCLVNKNPLQLVNWLQKVFGREQVQSLSITIERFMTDAAKFKCILLPIKSESKFNDFIKNYWDDLDKASANFLDIFYCEKELNQSGYITLPKFRELKIGINLLPCIVIWKDNISEYKTINIKKLNNADIFTLFQMIIQFISNGFDLEHIVDEANKKVEELIDNNKPIVKNSIIVKDSANAQIIYDNHGVINNEFKNVISEKDLIRAKELIDKQIELEKSQKEYLTKLLEEYKDSVNKNNEQKQKKCKEKWLAFKAGLGKAALTIINVLGSISSIVSLFN